MPAPPDDFLDSSVSALGAEVERVVQALRIGSIREEEDFTSEMLAGIRCGLARVRIYGMEWQSTVLKKQTEEPAVGADFAGVLRWRVDDYTVDKAFLAQAKMAGPRRHIRRKKLLAQVEAMLAVTSAAYVFLYRPTGISVVPALAVAAAGGDPRGLAEWSFTDFFGQHFRCFVGDRSLAPGADVSLGDWVEEMPARRALIVEGRRETEPGSVA